MRPSTQLLDFLQQNPLPWLRYDQEKQKLILVVDNHLLSTYRACPQHFVYAHVQGIKRKGMNVSGVERNWFLDFGVVVHKLLEDYYTHFRNPGFDPIPYLTERACAAWVEKDLDVHKDHKEYKLIGGLPGFTGLLIQYALTMTPLNERLRVLGTEISFGQNLEVPLYIGEDFEVYLAGRMDMIVDDGYFICPMDHKTMGTFRGDPGLKFETEEGPTGYIYALKTVLPQFVGAYEILKRDCSKILMNLIQKTPTSTPQKRFRRIAIRKTSAQLEQYRLRMTNTAEHLLLDMQILANDFAVSRNTNVCQNWMHMQCAFFDICRQNSEDAELVTIKNGYSKAPLWNTETVNN